MTLDENVGGIISPERAKVLIKAFGKKFPGEVTSSFIGAKNVKQILNQENCIGIRIHNGYDVESNKISLVFVGVDKDEKELLEGGLIYDRVLPCPEYCPIDGLSF